ncbi:VOC family protein [Nocardioides pantholopis]|uniref:VOC family protein n=1 Tax=Nocardioides pantholopis TaxID=2483798 RepID=UPI000F088690|nr:VOC family protein [Nocardioides pantholopis]
MEISSFYPVLTATDVASSAAFYRRWLGFETTFESDWYVSLAGPAGELALLDPTHETVPAGFGRPAQGVLLNVEVPDVDAEWRRLVVDGGVECVVPLRTEEFGQRHFIARGPDDVLIDVITVTPPSDRYAANYTDRVPD